MRVTLAGNRDTRQIAAITERTTRNIGDRTRNRILRSHILVGIKKQYLLSGAKEDGRKLLTTIENPSPDAGHATGNCDTRQTFAIGKRTLSDFGDAVGDRDAR